MFTAVIFGGGCVKILCIYLLEKQISREMEGGKERHSGLVPQGQQQSRLARLESEAWGLKALLSHTAVVFAGQFPGS